MTKKRWALLLTLGLLSAGLALAASQLGIGEPPDTPIQTQTPPQATDQPAQPEETPMSLQPPPPAQPPSPVPMQAQPQPQLQPQAPREEDRERLRREIALLKLLAEMDLTQEQLGQIQALVRDLKAKREAIGQAQLELRDFLLSYSGPDNGQTLEEALRPYEEKIEAARKDFRDALQASVDRLKEILTLKQGEILQEFLLKHFAVPKEREGEEEGEVHLWISPCPRPFPLPKEGNVKVRIEGRPCLGLRSGAGPDRALWESLEERMERFGEQMEALQERIEEWLGPWDWDVRIEADLETLKEKLRALREREPSWRIRIEGKGPWPRFPKREWAWWATNALLQRFLVENLDLLDTILTEKLERLGTTQL